MQQLKNHTLFSASWDDSTEDLKFMSARNEVQAAMQQAKDRALEIIGGKAKGS